MTVADAVRKPALERDHALALLREMRLIRHFEEKAAELYTEGKIRGFLHPYIGEEAIAAGALQALTPDGTIPTSTARRTRSPSGSSAIPFPHSRRGCASGASSPTRTSPDWNKRLRRRSRRR